MKKEIALFVFASMFWFHQSASSQSNQKPLDGRQYQVDLYIKADKDSHQSLIFKDGVMSFSEGAAYGFKPEEYKCKQKNDSTWTFLTISKSAKNGTMTWDGKVINDRIEGTCEWTRLVENPVKYTFKGKEFISK